VLRGPLTDSRHSSARAVVLGRLAWWLALVLAVSPAPAGHAQRLLSPPPGSGGPAPPAVSVLPHVEQASVIRAWIERRFDVLLPSLMRQEGIDMWIVISQEYNDDPVFRSLAPLTTFSSRRRTMLVFFDRGPGQPIERISVGRFDYDGVFQLYPIHDSLQWVGLRQVVAERAPRVIGVNMSRHWRHADGLTATDRDELVRILGPELSRRIRSAEMLVVKWLETMLPEQLEVYRHVMQVAHGVIAEAFSNRVIVPGLTTTDDVVWWMRQRVAELGLGLWFHPSVSIQRAGGLPPQRPPRGYVIERGDLLHTDFGVVYFGLSTDTQHHAYVLRPGETEAPPGLREGLRQANRLQDLVFEYARVGRTGNQALADALSHARREGLDPAIYCHPIGYHGHGAGVPIGMTDYQGGVPVRGEHVFRPNTWHSIELNVHYAVPEWNGQRVRFALEEDAALTPRGWEWVSGRQTRFYLVR
jgi:Xaa-Pro aminopeptidase